MTDFLTNCSLATAALKRVLRKEPLSVEAVKNVCFLLFVF
jgi:hypothetical protein